MIKLLSSKTSLTTSMQIVKQHLINLESSTMKNTTLYIIKTSRCWVHIFSRIITRISVNGIRACDREEASRCGRMDRFLKGIDKMTCRMEKVG